MLCAAWLLRRAFFFGFSKKIQDEASLLYCMNVWSTKFAMALSREARSAIFHLNIDYMKKQDATQFASRIRAFTDFFKSAGVDMLGREAFTDICWYNGIVAP